jgi:hypothetical protein
MWGLLLAALVVFPVCVSALRRRALRCFKQLQLAFFLFFFTIPPKLSNLSSMTHSSCLALRPPVLFLVLAAF